MLVTTGLCAYSGDSSSSSSTSPAPYADKIAQSQQKLEEHIQPGKPGCSVAVGVDGKVVWVAARGMADVAKRVPITATSTFETGYVSHQFVAAAALLLVRDGKLSLETPVNGHVAGLPEWGRRITVGHLLHHESGIPDYVDSLFEAGARLSPTT